MTLWPHDLIAVSLAQGAEHILVKAAGIDLILFLCKWPPVLNCVTQRIPTGRGDSREIVTEVEKEDGELSFNSKDENEEGSWSN